MMQHKEKGLTQRAGSSQQPHPLAMSCLLECRRIQPTWSSKQQTDIRQHILVQRQSGGLINKATSRPARPHRHGQPPVLSGLVVLPVVLHDCSVCQQRAVTAPEHLGVALLQAGREQAWQRFGQRACRASLESSMRCLLQSMAAWMLSSTVH